MKLVKGRTFDICDYILQNLTHNISKMNANQTSDFREGGNDTLLDARKQRLDMIGHGVVVLTICIIGM